VSDPPDGTVAVYADYVCPFCFLGRESLRRYAASRAEAPTIAWRPFDLRADRRGSDGGLRPADDRSDEDYYDRVRENVARLAERYGVGMAREVATGVDSLPAQRLSYRLAREHAYETWLAFDEAVYEALWLDDEPIDEPDLLVELAVEAGVDAADARAALDDDDALAALRAAFEDARRAGVTGVPTFVAGGERVRGAVPPARLRRLLEG
jgi:predicted DsbA family dithiol-disulfide isomerase